MVKVHPVRPIFNYLGGNMIHYIIIGLGLFGLACAALYTLAFVAALCVGAVTGWYRFGLLIFKYKFNVKAWWNREI